MTDGYVNIAATPSVLAAQSANGSRMFAGRRTEDDDGDRLTDAESAFIAERDSFVMATVSETGWPYVQHRGGPVGFLKVLDERTLGFADYRGNRQYVSLGNVGANARAALLLIDHAHRRRLKLFAEVEVRALDADAALTASLENPDYRAKPERLLLLHVAGFDWNCPQHITPRFTEAELADALAPVRHRLANLEAENAALREKLAAQMR